ncbi:signal-induced proliferation-associated 1-like protein 2 isoform X3 [Astyanax mexicanus]|uniref:signal-induced proliferation-associated 1-like protein 2 isoform X3 n=1 Tax=Astyanax mexicanus TaxID=7994 RepID=UPI0020CAC0F9|nr:signal-induced proliferation-associated 1-like protein 2 isoform X3 [Astyanax mexicanus]
MLSSEELNQKLKSLNGNMGTPPAGTQGKPEWDAKANGNSAMPKMGMRARASEWLPRQENWECRGGPNYESIIMGFQNGQLDQKKEICEVNEALLEPDCSDTKYSLNELLSRSPIKGLHPIRQRSNSDVTISDIDAEDLMDQNAINPNTGASLHREYGSTSSIDRQGLGPDGFFTLIKGCKVDALGHRGIPPIGFSELLCCDTTLSPSLQTAARIARGEIVRISGYDHVDSSIFYTRERDKSFMRRLRTDPSETSLFRKLRTKSEHDGFRLSTEQDDRQPLSFQKCFAHYDVQSILFKVSEAVANRANLGQRKNTTTGASAASQYQVTDSVGESGNATGPAPLFESPLGSHEDLNPKEDLDADEGDGKSNGLVLSCPHFRNEIGGEGERRISLSRINNATHSGGGENCSFESSLSSHCTNAGVSVLEVPRENQPIHREKVKRYIIEHIDLGAYYYHKYFYTKEHQNYFGVDDNLGPVAISVRREKLEDGKEKEGSPYNYRVIVRTSQLTTLRGAILEDAVPSTARHGTARGLPLKEVLEYVVPALSIQCLRLALNSPRVPEQLIRLDEQGLSFQHKVGVLYCKAGQSTEEEMYNNESAGPAMEEFLDLLGQRVRLKGFSKYRAQLDNKTDSTGTHSFYTTYKDYELMFHVSTLLPYTPNNRQQLLRKRHIGNDIVTIVFQEPGALPFTPKNIRSHFQHVFVIVKVHNPCTETVCYSVAVSRSKDVPPFGPPIPKGVTFPKSAVFRDFLLAKVINGENAAHKSEKFCAMATRTRQEYLKDLAENSVSTATVDSAVKFSFITLGAKRKERVKPRKDAHLHSVGAVTWSVMARDFGQSTDAECLLGISNEFIVLIEEESKNVVFNCSCRDVIGWTSSSTSIKVFYERGECVMLLAQSSCGLDIREIVQRLEIVSRGCETLEMTLRRNSLGQLGFHVNFEGIVADVEAFGFAWKAGLRQGSRLVEICKVAVATLTHEQMIDLLRTSVTVKVVIIQPYEDGAPRRGCSELYRIPMVEYKLDSEGTPCEYKTPFRRNTTWHRVPTTIAGQPLPRGSPTQCKERGKGQSALQHSQASIPRSTSFDRKLPDSSRALQDMENPHISNSKTEVSQHYRSSPSNQSSSSDPGPSVSTTWSQQPGYEGSQSPLLHKAMRGESDELRDRESTLERAHSAEAKWHIPPTKILNSMKERGKDSPSKLIRGGDKNCSHSSSNTLSSSASSSNSDEKHFGSGDLMDPEMLGLTYIKGASTDSGIDTAPCCAPPPPPDMAATAAAHMVLHGQEIVEQESWTTEHQEDNGAEEELTKLRQLYLMAPCQSMTVAENREGRSKAGMLPEDHLKLMMSPPGEQNHRKALPTRSPSARHSLYRTLSDESVCSNRKASSFSSSRSSMLDQAVPNDILFSSTRPYHSTLPPRISLSQPVSNLRNEFWFSDGSLADRSKFNDPGLMPLPDTATDLDWSHLVDAARAFEDQRVASFCTMTDIQRAEALQISQELTRHVAAVGESTLKTGENSPATLTGKVNQLEVILRQLQHDLRKSCRRRKKPWEDQDSHLRGDHPTTGQTAFKLKFKKSFIHRHRFYIFRTIIACH